MICGIVLAAGRGRRAGGPKALLTLEGGTFYERAVRSFRDAGLVVIGVVNRDIQDALAPPIAGEDRVVNASPDDEEGMFSSVRLGVNAALDRNAAGCLLLPVDLPRVTVEDVRQVVEHLGRGASIVVPTHGGRRGHPIGLSPDVMVEVASSPRSTTLRQVVRRDATRVTESEGSPGVVLGVNTKEDLLKLSERGYSVN